MNLIKSLAKNLNLAFQSIRKNIPLFLLSCFIDLVFLIFSFIMLGFTIKKIFDSLIIVLPILNQYSAIAQQITINPESVAQIDFSVQNALISQNLSLIISSALIFALLIFIAWCILQSLSWFIANKMLQNRVKFFSFFIKFSLVSFVLFLIASLISIISFDAIRRSMTSMMYVSSNTILITSAIIFIAVFYFIIIAYSVIQKCSLKELLKVVFMISVKKIKYAFTAYFVLIFIGFLIYLLLKYSFTVSYLLAIILFLIISLPYLAMSKIFLIKTINEIEK